MRLLQSSDSIYQSRLGYGPTPLVVVIITGLKHAAMHGNEDLLKQAFALARAKDRPAVPGQNALRGRTRGHNRVPNDVLCCTLQHAYASRCKEL